MKPARALEEMAARLNRMSLRERVLIFGASIAVLFVLWTVALMDPLDAHRNDLLTELTALQESIDVSTKAAQALNVSDPVSVAFARQRTLQADLAVLNTQLASESAGLIEARRMSEVIHDVLSRQQGIRLVSLRNLPARSLAKEDRGTSPAIGPYLHPVELVVEGRYLDTLAYVRALEGLPWQFYWRLLELRTTEYPTNRVRIELGTLSMEKEWIGI